MKLTNLIVEEDSFTFTNKQVDPETGRISWTVEYHPVIKTTKSLEEAEKNLKALVNRDPEDELIKELYVELRALRKLFVRKYGKR